MKLSVFTPFLYGVLAIIILNYSGLDLTIAEQIFRINQGFAWRESWLLQTVLHQSGRNLIGIVFLITCLVTLASYVSKRFSPVQRIVFSFATVTMLLSTLSVSLLKNLTTLPCPWSLKVFGGNSEYVYLHDIFSADFSAGHCFPSGHASAGFALFSLYFAAKLHASITQKTPKPPSVKWLLPGLVVGSLFGIAQELRGAHFLSHDIASALCCWYLCAGCYWLTLNRLKKSYQVKQLRQTINNCFIGR